VEPDADMEPELVKEEEVTECVRLSVHVHVTVSPTWMEVVPWSPTLRAQLRL
jgi:hypothetical protein